jgi:hypothetical protein
MGVNSNLPGEPLRWPIDRAAREFGVQKSTLAKRLALVKEKPHPVTQTYSTHQITIALYGDIQSERLREVKERADNLMLKNGALRGELLEREVITKAGEEMLIAARALIETSSMPRNEKNDFLENLASWPVAVRDVAKRQTRQIHIRRESEESGNGKEDDGE